VDVGQFLGSGYWGAQDQQTEAQAATEIRKKEVTWKNQLHLLCN